MLYQGEGEADPPPIQEWRRFDAADMQPSRSCSGARTCGRRGASSWPPARAQGGHEQPGAVLRAKTRIRARGARRWCEALGQESRASAEAKREVPGAAERQKTLAAQDGKPRCGCGLTAGTCELARGAGVRRLPQQDKRERAAHQPGEPRTQNSRTFLVEMLRRVVAQHVLLAEQLEAHAMRWRRSVSPSGVPVVPCDTQCPQGQGSRSCPRAAGWGRQVQRGLHLLSNPLRHLLRKVVAPPSSFTGSQSLGCESRAGGAPVSRRFSAQNLGVGAQTADRWVCRRLGSNLPAVLFVTR